MRKETRASRQQSDDDGERGTGMAEHLNRKQSATDRANHGVDGVTDRIHPWNFVGEKLKQIETASDSDDPWIAEDFERLILRCERDQVEMNGKTSGEDCEIKIDPGERGETKCDAEDVKPFHE